MEAEKAPRGSRAWGSISLFFSLSSLAMFATYAMAASKVLTERAQGVPAPPGWFHTSATSKALRHSSRLSPSHCPSSH
jgi:hypothetical protein